jgi:hypothetical protein
MDDELMLDAVPAGDVEAGAVSEMPGEEAPWEAWVEAQEVALEDAEAEGLRPGGVPYDRDEEAEYARQEEAEQFGAFAGWAPALQQLEALGITPEQFAARLEEVQGGGQPEWQAPQEQQFPDWLEAQEIDAEECTRAELLSLQATWRQEQAVAQYQQEAEAAQFQAFQTQWYADLQQVASEYPEFGNPVLRDALINTYEGRFGVQPDADLLGSLAGELREAIQVHTSAQVARYAQQKQWDASVPVVAGGSAPAPVGAVDFHHLNPTQQQEFLESHFAAVSRGA